uniref:Uncharacterized protein n=1 Tax=Cryptosporidium parvum TaxID=5807 RepID=F0X5N0_CRYPV
MKESFLRIFQKVFLEGMRLRKHDIEGSKVYLLLRLYIHWSFFLNNIVFLIER